MNKETLQDAIGNVKEPLLNEADAMRSGAYKKRIMARNRRLRRTSWRNMGVAAACICLVITGVIRADIWNPFGSGKDAALNAIVYEERADVQDQDAAKGLENSAPNEAAGLQSKDFLEEAAEEKDQMKGSVSGNQSHSVAASGSGSEVQVISEYNADTESGEMDWGDTVEEGFTAWTRDSIQTYLTGAENNVLYSPVNVYSMLALLGTVGNGEQQQQILERLQVEDEDALYAQYQAIWNLVNRTGEDGEAASEMANSLWLSNRLNYNDELVRLLSEDMKLSSFIGEMGSEGLNNKLHEWMNAHTGDMLTDQIEMVNTDPDQLLTMATTLYYKASWTDKFNVAMTTSDSFYGKAGEQEAEYMSGKQEIPYIDGDGYQACFLSTADGGGMWIILPDEGVEADQLLADEQVLALLQGAVKPEDTEAKELTLKLPKFDVCSELEARDGLAQLGITAELTPDEELFHPADEEEALGVPQNLKHVVRVKIDEEGCEAAAFSVLEKSAEPEEAIYMMVNRPFLMSVVTADQIPLFTGVINNME